MDTVKVSKMTPKGGELRVCQTCGYGLIKRGQPHIKSQKLSTPDPYSQVSLDELNI